MGVVNSRIHDNRKRVNAMAIITVPSGSSIQAAVNAANQGDVILVENGTFTEEVSVVGKDNLRIVAKHKQQAVLDGQGTLAVAFTLSGVSGVEINGFVIKNYTALGINATGGGGHHRIIQNRIKDIIGTGTGISLGVATDGNLVWRNTVKRTGTAINVTSSGNWIVENKLRMNLSSGVDISEANNAVVNNRIVDSGGGGIQIFGSQENTLLLNNEIRNSGGNGIVSGTPNTVMLRNYIQNTVGSGINISNTNIYAANNKVKNSQNTGILVNDSFNNIENNLIKRNNNNGIGITSGANKNFIFRNELEDNQPQNIVDNGTDNVKLQNDID